MVEQQAEIPVGCRFESGAFDTIRMYSRQFEYYR